MPNFLRKKRIERYLPELKSYVRLIYLPPRPPAPPKPVTPPPAEKQPSVASDGIKYSARVDCGIADDLTAMLRGGYDTELLRGRLERSLELTFTEKLIEIIDRKKLRDAAVYRAAQMDRRLFSKIMSNRSFHPSRDTALALAFALRLPLKEAEDLLSRAGYALSRSNKRDVILTYFLSEGIFDLVEINLVLERLGEKLIGR